jgi:hypothetical protein
VHGESHELMEYYTALTASISEYDLGCETCIEHLAGPPNLMN